MKTMLMTSRSRIMLFFKGPAWVKALAFLLAAATPALPTLVDVGLVTKLSGEATYWNKEESKRPAAVQAFMKVRRGDHLKLADAASVQVLYFTSGRQETWKGPGTIIIGDRESTAAGDQKLSPTEVVNCPTKVTKVIAGSPLPLPRSSTHYSGVIHVRGAKSSGPEKARKPAPLSAEDRDRIAAAKKTYLDLKKSVGPDDLTPELYYLAVLADYEQYADMEALLSAMQQKSPGDTTLKELQTWVRAKSPQPKSPGK